MTTPTPFEHRDRDVTTADAEALARLLADVDRAVKPPSGYGSQPVIDALLLLAAHARDAVDRYLDADDAPVADVLLTVLEDVDRVLLLAASEAGRLANDPATAANGRWPFLVGYIATRNAANLNADR